MELRRMEARTPEDAREFRVERRRERRPRQLEAASVIQPEPIAAFSERSNIIWTPTEWVVVHTQGDRGLPPPPSPTCFQELRPLDAGRGA